MPLAMKVVFTAFLLVCFIESALTLSAQAFDIFHSMDETREALMSFYDPYERLPLSSSDEEEEGHESRKHHPGPVGDRGPVGFPGLVGHEGRKHMNSSSSDEEGHEGRKHHPGPAGDRGHVGFPGLVGHKGRKHMNSSSSDEEGHEGRKHHPGPAGDRGPVGFPGLVGHKGRKHMNSSSSDEEGHEGRKHHPGPVGDRGPAGDRGLVGHKGRKHMNSSSSGEEGEEHEEKQIRPSVKLAPFRKRASSNKYVEALEDIEKASAEAQQTDRPDSKLKVTHNTQRLRRLQDLIKAAVKKRSYRFARKAIGEAMFTITKIKEMSKRKGRRKRATVISLKKDFLGKVKKAIGIPAFKDLFAMQGQVTLMFAIDTTGSMSEEIGASKKIVESIVNENRSEPVDYILSPFSDPASYSGPVQYFREQESDSFVKALNNLNARGGDDCPELTFKGMIDAINVGQPHPDSPMYVFTDANSKDHTEENKRYLLEVAEAEGVVINFFYVESPCSKASDITPFEEVALQTTGQVFRLKNVAELEQLQGLTAVSLGGTAVISNAVGTISSRKRRSASSKRSKSYRRGSKGASRVVDGARGVDWDTWREQGSGIAIVRKYSIPVDDSIDTLVVSVTTDQSRSSISSANYWSVSLTTPSGSIAGIIPRNLDKGAVFEVSKPSVGVWNLAISSDYSVNYDYYAKGTSVDNIDFEYYFVKKNRKGSFIPITSPLQDEQAHAILTLGGVDKIDQSSLQAELMTLDGELVKTTTPVSLKSKDKAGVRHYFTFTPPGQLFKIKLRGKTKKGNSFERICHKAIKSETLLVKLLYAKNDFTIPQGKATYIIFTTENHGNNEVVDIRVFGSMGKVDRISRTSVVIRKRRRSSFFVTFSASPSATKGITITIVASVKGKTSGSKSTLSIPLLVV